MEDTFAQRLAKAIRFRGLTEYDICNISDISRLTLQHYLTGRREPTLKNLAKLQKALDADLEWLISGK
jgi:transcriptional regulator with XRE-family HTH domain